MLRPVSFPPPCGALCPGCKICCDLVVEERYPAAAVCDVDRARKSADGDVLTGPNVIRRQHGSAGGSTPGETSIVVAQELAGKSAGKDGVRISRSEIDAPRLPCATCGRWPGKRSCCRRDVTCDRDVWPATHTCAGCSRDCGAARRARCKCRKLRCAALCCTGRSACYERSFSPRRRDCHCVAKQSRWCTKRL